MNEAGHVTDAKTFAIPATERRREHQSRRNPGQAGDSHFWKGRSHHESRQRCDEIAFAQEFFGAEWFHLAQLASKGTKRKNTQNANHSIGLESTASQPARLRLLAGCGHLGSRKGQRRGPSGWPKCNRGCVRER